VKKLVISQRVDENEAYAERRDCLDQRWYDLADRLDCAPIPLPNIHAAKVDGYLSLIEPDAIILSGGNTLIVQEKTAKDAAPERDSFESALLEWALLKSKPVMGICRGMLFINHYFGGLTREIEKHVGGHHRITFCGDFADTASIDVNSFHSWGLRPNDLGKQLSAFAIADDGTVEALSHATHDVTAIMWHPERESTFSELDLSLIRRSLKL
jgi:putative glutamine amidotransferase